VDKNSVDKNSVDKNSVDKNNTMTTKIYPWNFTKYCDSVYNGTKLMRWK
jgi:hypothetical protein